jgi:drug/metabolite transporter (DMT)-like permease
MRTAGPTTLSSTAAATATHTAAIHLRLLGMALLWGGSFPAGRTLAHAMPPLTGAAWRFTLATVVLLAWMCWLDRGGPRLNARQWAGLAAGGVIGVAGYAVFFMLALERVEASRVAIVVTTNPVFTTLLAAWLFREKFNTRIALGMVLAIVGAATVMTQGAPWKLVSSGIGSGEWPLLGCIATWVGYTLLARGLLAGVDSLVATTVTAVTGTLLLWIVALAYDGAPVIAGSLVGLAPSGWASLVFLAIGSTVLAYAWYLRGVAELGAGTAASYISLVPVFGVAASVLVLGESLNTSLLVGGALAMAGVVLTNRARR